MMCAGLRLYPSTTAPVAVEPSRLHDPVPPRATSAPPRRSMSWAFAVLVFALLLGQLAGCYSATTSTGPAAATTSSSSEHHVVHDVHCEPMTVPAGSTGMFTAPSGYWPAAAVLGVITIVLAGLWRSRGPATRNVPPPWSWQHSSGRFLLLAAGVDRN